jgi:hypothetical protein
MFGGLRSVGLLGAHLGFITERRGTTAMTITIWIDGEMSGCRTVGLVRMPLMRLGPAIRRSGHFFGT